LTFSANDTLKQTMTTYYIDFKSILQARND